MQHMFISISIPISLLSPGFIIVNKRTPTEAAESGAEHLRHAPGPLSDMATFTKQEGTVLGPLTTAWAMPSDCMVQMLNCATCSEGFAGQSCYIGGDGVGSARDHTGCWPPTTERAGTPRHPFVGWGFYSPGLECPTGYTAACTARYDRRPEWDIQFNLREGETAVGCCPQGFRCTNRNGNTCILIASTEMESSVVVETGSCSGTDIGAKATATFPDLITQTVTTSEASVIETVLAMREITLLIPMIQLNYRASDLVASTSETSPTDDDRLVATTSSGRTGTAPAEPADDSLDSNDSMSGARIGTIVGATLGGVLVIALLAWLLWRRRKRRQGTLDTRGTMDDGRERIAEVQFVDYHQAKSGTYGDWMPLELDTHQGPKSPVELPTEYMYNQTSPVSR